MKNRKEYEKRLKAFNKACGASYISQVNFVILRKTTKGIKIGFSLGKPYEIAKLRADVEKAGKPYYCNF